MVRQMDKFLYLLSDPETGFVRWVGASCNPKTRYYSHISEKSTIEKDAWMASLKGKGLRPVMEVLSETPIANWEEEEIFLIMYLRFLGADLLNLDAGGKHGVRSALSLRRHAAKLKGVKRWSPEQIEEIGARFRGKPSKLKGRKLDPSNTRDQRRCTKPTPETRIKMNTTRMARSEARKSAGIPFVFSESHKAAIAAGKERARESRSTLTSN